MRNAFFVSGQCTFVICSGPVAGTQNQMPSHTSTSLALSSFLTLHSTTHIATFTLTLHSNYSMSIQPLLPNGISTYILMDEYGLQLLCRYNIQEQPFIPSKQQTRGYSIYHIQICWILLILMYSVTPKLYYCEKRILRPHLFHSDSTLTQLELRTRKLDFSSFIPKERIYIEDKENETFLRYVRTWIEEEWT